MPSKSPRRKSIETRTQDTGEHHPRRRSDTPQQCDEDDCAPRDITDVDADVERNAACEEEASRSRFDRAFEEWQQPRRIDDVASDAADNRVGGKPIRTEH